MAKPDIVATINNYNTFSAQDLVMAYGGSIGRAAAAVAGVPYGKGVSKDKAYLAERRSIERQLKGQFKHPSKAKQEKFNEAGAATRKGQKTNIHMDGKIAVNGQGANYERDRTIDRTFSDDEWAELSELAAERDEEGIWDYIADHYGVDYLEVMDGTIDIN